MIHRSVPCSTCDQRRDVFASLLKSKKFTKIQMDRGFNLDLRSSNKEIKKSTKRCDLTSFHMKFDHHMCMHVRKILVSVWPSDRSEKILKKNIKNRLSNFKHY